LVKPSPPVLNRTFKFFEPEVSNCKLLLDNLWLSENSKKNVFAVTHESAVID